MERDGLPSTITQRIRIEQPMLLFILLCLWLGQGQVNATENQSAANAQQQAAQSPSPVVERAETGKAGNSGQQNQNKAQWSDPLVILNFALFVAVLIQAGIYWKQLGKMREQTEIARQSATAAEMSARAAQESAHLMAQTQRPDMVLTLKFGDLMVGRPLQMEFEAFNAGKETAYNFGIHISADFKPPDFDGVLDYGKPKPEATEPIRPQERKYIHPHWPQILRERDIAALLNGAIWFFVFGVMWYEDGGGSDTMSASAEDLTWEVRITRWNAPIRSEARWWKK